MAYNKSARHRHLMRAGREITITNYIDSGNRDKYNDPTGFSEEKIATYGVLEWMFEEELWNYPSGQEVEIEGTAYIPDEVELYTADDDSAVKASRLKDSITDDVWEVLDIRTHPDGLQRVLITDA